MHKVLLLLPLLLLIKLSVDNVKSYNSTRPASGVTLSGDAKTAQNKALLKAVVALAGLGSLSVYLYKDYQMGDFEL